MNNTPIHNPLIPPDLQYGSDHASGLSVLLEVDESHLRVLLDETPFEFISAHAWIEVMRLEDAFGVKPFAGGGVIIPARYRGTVGGYYAFCYIDTDDALALGREPFGYPKKYAVSNVQRTGDVATAYMYADAARIELSVMPGRDVDRLAAVPRYPHLLLQILPSAESAEPLLKRVIARDTAATSNMTSTVGAASATISGSELSWLADSRVVGGTYAQGSFHGAMGQVLGTEFIGRELREAFENFETSGKPHRVQAVRNR